MDNNNKFIQWSNSLTPKQKNSILWDWYNTNIIQRQNTDQLLKELANPTPHIQIKKSKSKRSRSEDLNKLNKDTQPARKKSKTSFIDLCDTDKDEDEDEDKDIGSTISKHQINEDSFKSWKTITSEINELNTGV